MKKRRFKYTRKFLKWLYYFAEAILALIIVLGGLTFWHLYTHPMSADSLLPEITKQLLPSDVSYSINADHSLLYAMPNKKGIVHLNLKNFTVKKEDGQPVVSLPELNLSYGLWHLLTLNYLPDHLEILNPSFHMTINEKGTFISQDQP